MSAHAYPRASLEWTKPAVRSLLDDHFHDDELDRAVGGAAPSAIAHARRAIFPALADLLARPGKEVRARLVEHAYAIAHAASPCACARLPEELPLVVEMLHAGSLVVDDIEDDAEERRGAPALHRTHGLPVALNAGNWLYFWPLTVISRLPVDPATTLALYRRTSTTLLRCHHGQALDLGVTITELPQREVRAVVELSTRLKTGSLLELACAHGAIAAHAPPDVERALATFGREIGVAFQMLDDLSGLISPARRGKAEEDLAAARPTWPWVWLADELDAHSFRALQRMASAARERTPTKEGLLPERRLDLVFETMKSHFTSKDRRRPLEHIEKAIADLIAVVGERPEVTALVRDVRALEHAHV